MKSQYIISIGSNTSAAKANVKAAIEYLSDCLSGFKQSSVYSTPSIKNDGTTYHNAVVSGFSALPVGEMSQNLKAYETRAGRVHGSRSVVIDLDIVKVDDEVLRPKDFARSYFTIGLNELG